MNALQKLIYIFHIKNWIRKDIFNIILIWNGTPLGINMNFKSISHDFFESSVGTDSFRELYKKSFLLMKEEPQHAIIYHLIGCIARSYVTTYDDQEVKPENALKAKSLLEHFNNKILTALDSDAETCLKIVSEISLEYQYHIHDF